MSIDMTPERLDILRRKFSVQVADLINVAGVPALTLATMLLDVSLAICVRMGVKPREIAETLRMHARRLDELAKEDQARLN